MLIGNKLKWLSAALCSFALTAACGDDDDSAPAPPGAGGEASGGEASGGGEAPQATAGEPPTGQSGRGEEPAVTDFIERLDRLGAKTDLVEEPVDRAGKRLPDGYHPLKKPFATLGGRDEIYFGGPRLDGIREGILDDGFEGGFSQLLSPQFAAWHDLSYRTAVAADVNGDGIQEFVGVYFDPARKELMGKVTLGPEWQARREGRRAVPPHEGDAASKRHP